MKHKICMRVLAIVIVGIFFMSLPLGISAQAAGLTDDTVDISNEYSQYPLDNYKLDFYVDTSWDWLPWNWGDGIGNKFEQALYGITDAIWWVSRTLSNATGYIVQEAYTLDFIARTSNAIGQNIQTLAGITSNGFSLKGFWPGFLLLLLLVLGVYVAYTGMIKKETSKAMNAVVSFVLIFIVSIGFIAYAPSYITKINEFSSDVSTAALDLGTDIIMPNSNTSGGDSTDLIRDSLFGIQVRQPWLLLQFGTTDISSLTVGENRVDTLLSTSPDADNGGDRESVVKSEIEDYDNMNMSVNKVTARLGMVLLLLIVNIAISIFVILLSGLMLFSQILFIMYATMLPICLLLSMIPTFNGLAKRSVEKVFNAIMLRAGYTIIITAAFSISSMLYSLSGSMPLLFVAFLQIATFAGIYMKQNDLLNMIALQGSDNQGMTRRMRMGARRMNRVARRMERNVRRSTGGGVINTIRRTFSGSGSSRGNGGGSGNSRSNCAGSGSGNIGNNHNIRGDSSVGGTGNSRNGGGSTSTGSGTMGQGWPNRTDGTRQSLGEHFGSAVGNIADFPARVAAEADSMVQTVGDTPTHYRYAVHRGKERISNAVQHSKEHITDNIQDFGRSVASTQTVNQTRRTKKQDQYWENVSAKKSYLQSGAKGRGNIPAGSDAVGNSGPADSDKQLMVKSAMKRQPHEGVNERGNVSTGFVAAGNSGTAVSDKRIIDKTVAKRQPHDGTDECGNILAGFGTGDNSGMAVSDKRTMKKTIPNHQPHNGTNERGNVPTGSGTDDNGMAVSDKRIIDKTAAKRQPHGGISERASVPAGTGTPVSSQYYHTGQLGGRSGSANATSPSIGECLSAHNHDNPYLVNGIPKGKNNLENFSGIEKRTSVRKQKDSVITSKKTTEMKRRE